jgi:hypothetical protein
MLPLCVHDLKPSLERVADSTPNAVKAVTCVTGIPASQLPPLLKTHQGASLSDVVDRRAGPVAAAFFSILL